MTPSENSIPLPFADAAQILAERGLAVIPCSGADGKVPAVKGFNRWPETPSPKTVEKWALQWPDANLGIVTSLSDLTVLDIDDPAQAEELADLFGPTPIVIETPSGGQHRYYRSSGEPSANLRSLRIIADLKGTSSGYVVAPHSVRPGDQKPYRFVEGSWDDLHRLPKMKPDNPFALKHQKAAKARPFEAQLGARNNTLFKRLLREAPGLDEQALVRLALELNSALPDPLSESEVLKTAHSASSYEREGKNWVGREAKSVVTRSIWDFLSAHQNGPDALMLLAKLEIEHGARSQRGECFAISPRAMEAECTMGNWSAKRIRRARNTLIETGIIFETYRGGKGKHDPSLFQFC